MNGENMRVSAAPIAYVVLTGVWFVLSVGYLLLYLRSGAESLLGGAGIALIPAFGFSLWLRGFLIVIEGSSLIYRDGLYRRSELLLDEALTVETTWVSWPLFGSQLGLPRLVLRSRTGASVVINTKPFRKADLRSMLRVLRTSTSARSSVAGA